MQVREDWKEIEGTQGPPGAEYPFNLEPWVTGSDIELKGLDCICPVCGARQRFFKLTRASNKDLDAASFVITILNICAICSNTLDFFNITADEKERLQLKMENSIQEGII